MRRTLFVLCLALVLSGCLRVTQEAPTVTLGPTTDSGAIGKQVLVRAMPNGEVRDAQHGKEVWFAYGAVMGVDGAKANGVGTAHYLEDGTFVIGIQLNIAPPAEGTFYEGWLIGEGGDRVSTGHFQQSLRETRQTLNFRTDMDLRKSLKIAVTSEKDDGNPAPGTAVAEGVLRVTKR